MAKKLEVDVSASLGYQENGRTKHTKKDRASVNTKRFVCPKCSSSVALSKKSFGEVVMCKECNSPMKQRSF